MYKNSRLNKENSFPPTSVSRTLAPRRFAHHSSIRGSTRRGVAPAFGQAPRASNLSFQVVTKDTFFPLQGVCSCREDYKGFSKCLCRQIHHLTFDRFQNRFNLLTTYRFFITNSFTYSKTILKIKTSRI